MQVKTTRQLFYDKYSKCLKIFFLNAFTRGCLRGNEAFCCPFLVLSNFSVPTKFKVNQFYQIVQLLKLSGESYYEDLFLGRGEQYFLMNTAF